MVVHSDCLHFRGHIPCKPHKEHGVHCDGCEHYAKRKGRILIIKLGAAGDVIRTSVLIEPLKEKYKDHEIWWLSLTPELISSEVQKRLAFSAESLLSLQNTAFDVAINLDKDHHACALMSTIHAEEKFGFTLVEGVTAPVNELARGKFLTGIFDDVNKANKVSYPQEIIELCGLPYSRQEYRMDAPGPSPLTLPSGAGPLVGLNTGCGDRWVTREWPTAYWIELIESLYAGGYRVLLLGGPAEHDKNVMLSEKTGAHYEGTFPLDVFPAVMNECDVVVTAVTMAMHVAIALKKQLVLMNNTFNKHEFELYDRGVIVEPDKECTCFFGQTCTNPDYVCIEHITPKRILECTIERASAHL